MTTALVPSNGWGREQVELLKRTICKGATDDELALFVQATQRLNLDPFARQVFAVKRWDSRERREVMAIQVSIDGFRLVAERTGKYAGQLGPFWTSDGEHWREVWLDSSKPPAASKVGVLRHDFKEPVWAVATWDHYKQEKRDGGLSPMWAKMGPLMLAKCAESLALRRAFPNELSGVYTQEEMQQAVTVEVSPHEAEEAAAREQYRATVNDGPKVTPPPVTGTPSAQPSAGPPPSPGAGGGTNGKGYVLAKDVPVFAKDPLANQAQLAQIHILRKEVNWPDGEVDESKPVKSWPLYRQALAAYKTHDGKRCLHSNQLTFDQAANLIRRMQASKGRKEDAHAAMEAAVPDNVAHLREVTPANFVEQLHDHFPTAEDEATFFSQIGLADADSVPDDCRAMVLELARAKLDNALAFHDALKKARTLGHVPSLVR